MEDLQHFKNDGANYYKLYIACPVCLMLGKPTSPSYWYHASCDGEIYIGDNGYYYCKNCGHKELIVNWAYGCPVHEEAGLGEYVKVDNLKHIAEAISIAGQITVVAELQWLNNLTSALLKQGVAK